MTAKIFQWPKQLAPDLRESLAEIAPAGPVNHRLVENLELLLKNAKEGRIHAVVAVYASATAGEEAAGYSYGGLERQDVSLAAMCMQIELAREEVKDYLFFGGPICHDLPELDA